MNQKLFWVPINLISYTEHGCQDFFGENVSFVKEFFGKISVRIFLWHFYWQNFLWQFFVVEHFLLDIFLRGIFFGLIFLGEIIFFGAWVACKLFLGEKKILKKKTQKMIGWVSGELFREKKYDTFGPSTYYVILFTV